MPPLSRSERLGLLALARQAVVEVVVHDRIPDLPSQQGRASQSGAAFVSVHHKGQLRGCVGRIDRKLALGEIVAQCAIGAVMRDPRFPPLRAEEVSEIDIEISVLSEFESILPEGIVPGEHGLFIVRGPRRGLLLPQVAAEHQMSAERFLAATCEKAGLEPQAWRDQKTQVFGFTTEVFCESDLAKT